jgi:hypothetical protein
MGATVLALFPFPLILSYVLTCWRLILGVTSQFFMGAASDLRSSCYGATIRLHSSSLVCCSVSTSPQ